MDELWQPVTGYESFYEVSNLGRVRSHSRITTQLSKVGIPMTKTSKGKILRPGKQTSGYHTVCLCDGNTRRTILVHRLVAKAFIANQNGLKEINHIDGDKLNNAATNLEWCTRSENLKHAFRTGLAHKISNKPRLRKLATEQVRQIVSLVKDGRSVRSLALEYGIDRMAIKRILDGKTYRDITVTPAL